MESSTSVPRHKKRKNGSSSPSKRGRNHNGNQHKLTSPCFQSESRHKVSNDDDPEYVVMFPAPYAIWIILGVTVLVRMYVVSRKDSSWILHPDEVYQGIEVAHGLVYGYGFRPYEYLPPPDPNSSLAVERQEAATGMYSLRSFLYPRVFATVLWAAHSLGHRPNPFFLCRQFHSLVAACLPLSVHAMVSALLYSKRHDHSTSRLRHDIATLCSVLVAFSEELTVLGTHCLVNSFLAPVLFMSLAFVVNRLNSMESDSCQPTSKDQGDTQGKPLQLVNNNHYMNGHVAERDATEQDLGIYGKSKETFTANGRSPMDWNPNNNGVHSKRNMENGKHEENYTQQSTGYQNNDKGAQSRNSETLERSLFTFISTFKIATIGFVLGILFYVRVDIILFIGLIVMSFSIPVIIRGNNFRQMVTLTTTLTFGAVVAIVICGWGDRLSYGSWFLSPWQWFRFNIRTGMSSILFGSQDMLYYPRTIFFRNPVTLCCIITVLGAFLLRLGNYQFMGKTKDVFHRTKCIAIPFLLMLGIYSLQEHKELRFIHNLLTLYTILVGISVYYLTLLVRNHPLRMIILYSVIVGWISRLVIVFPSPSDKTNVSWAYLDLWDTNYVNDCLEFVGQQPDATGLFLDRPIHATGAYSVLHKDIPMFTLVHYEFHEYGKSARAHLANEVSWHTEGPITLSLLSRVNNFITTENSALLLKYIILQSEYNYMIVRTTRDVIDIGFNEVYRSGTMRVLRRVFHPDAESRLRRLADEIPWGRNVTVLEYEGSWLHTFGLYQKAIERLEYALTLGTTPKIRTLQILSLCYRTLGNKAEAQRLYEDCLKIHGSVCAKPQPRVVLHTEYDLSL